MRIPSAISNKAFFGWLILIGAVAANLFGLIVAAISLRDVRAGGAADYAVLFATAAPWWTVIGIAVSAYLLFRAKTGRGYSFEHLALGYIGKNAPIVIVLASIAAFLQYRFLATPATWEVRSFVLCLLLSLAFAIALPISIQNTYVWFANFPDWWSRRKPSKARFLAKWQGASATFGGRRIKSLAFSADGKTVVSCGDAGVARFWGPDGRSSSDPLSIGKSESGLWDETLFEISPDGSKLAICDGHTIRLLDFNTRSSLWERPDPEYSVEAIAFSHDGKWVAVACNDSNRAGRVLLLDAASGALSYSNNAKYDVYGESMTAGQAGVPEISEGGHVVTEVRRKRGEITYTVNDVAFAPGGKEVCFVGGKTDFKDGQQDSIGVIAGFGVEGSWSQYSPSFSRDIGCVSASPAGFCALALDHGPVLLASDFLSLSSTETSRVLAGQRGGSLDLRFSPDGGLLAGAFADGTVRLWDSRNGMLKCTFDLRSKAHPHSFAGCVAFSRDGLAFSAANWDGEIFLWDISLVRS